MSSRRNTAPEAVVRSRAASILRGAAALTVIGLSTVILTVTLCVLALAKALVPEGPARHRMRARLAHVAELWIGVNNAVLALGRGLRWDVELPAGLDRNGCYVVICNHQSWVDILVLQRCFNRRLPLLRFFLKKQLFWVPFLGLAWWALDFPFMQRQSRPARGDRAGTRGGDLETARRACAKFEHVPVAMMNFLEGTRSTSAKRKRSGSPYRNLLKPRIGGLGQVLFALGGPLDACVDVTIAYPGRGDADPPTFWELFSGQVPGIAVRARLLEIPAHLRGRAFREDADFRAELDAWVAAIWDEKDRTIDVLLRA